MSEAEAGAGREHTAYHEAGHAVLHWVFGVDLLSVTIVPRGEYLGQACGGSLDAEVGDDWVHPSPEYALLRAHAIILVAGKVAGELHVNGSLDWSKAAYAGDRPSFIEIALRLGWGSSCSDGGRGEVDLTQALAEAEAEARNLLQARWGAVEGVAAALLRGGKLSGEDALRIMTEAGVPGPVADVWADVLKARRVEDELRARFVIPSDKPSTPTTNSPGRG